MKLKLAKTMEYQEMNFEKKRQSSITYKELRNILKNVNIKESCQNHFTEENNIFRFEPQQTSFMVNHFYKLTYNDYCCSNGVTEMTNC